MSDQPEALRLADILHYKLPSVECLEKAAAELRRLHEVNAEWAEKAKTWLASPEAAHLLDGYRDLAQRLNAVEQQRDELLAALRGLIDWFDDETKTPRPAPLKKARSAIKKVKDQS